MKPVVQKVGRITVAIGLVVFGIALLIDNLSGQMTYTGWVYKLWPALLIGFGLEYLIRSVLAQREASEAPDSPPRSLRFDLGGAFLLLLVIALSAGITTFRTWVTTAPGGRLDFVDFGGPRVSLDSSAVVPVDGAAELRIDVNAGTVRLEQHSLTDQVRVEATYTAQGFVFDANSARRDLERIRLAAERGNPITIRAEIPSDLRNVSVQFTVYAPPGMKIRAETGAGRIYVQHYNGDLDLRSGAGSIHVAAGAGSLNAGSGAGQITVADFEGPVSVKASVGTLSLRNIFGSIQADSGTGQILIREFQGPKVVAETRTGSISVSSNAVLAGDLVLKTSAGSINLDLPRDSSFRATAQTRAGSVTLPSFMATTGSTGPTRSGTGISGDGKHTITLEAGTGSIHFNLH